MGSICLQELIMISIALIAVLAVSASAFRLDQKIVNGDDAYEGQFPHQGSLQFTWGSHTCGCSLIGSNKVLTAAHCVGSGASSYRIGFGLHRRTGSGGNPEYYSVSRIIIHPDYQPDGSRGFPNDIAVMYTSGSVNTNNAYISIIQMASSWDSDLLEPHVPSLDGDVSMVVDLWEISSSMPT